MRKSVLMTTGPGLASHSDGGADLTITGPGLASHSDGRADLTITGPGLASHSGGRADLTIDRAVLMNETSPLGSHMEDRGFMGRTQWVGVYI